MTVIRHWIGHDVTDPALPHVIARNEAERDALAKDGYVVEGPFVLEATTQGAVEELRALVHAADEEARSQFEPPDRLREAILRADAWLTANGAVAP